MDEGIVYLNGEFVPESQAKVSVFDRGFNGGEGVYDVTRTFGHKPFKLKEHVQRLYRSLKYTRIDCGLSPDEMERLSLEVLERNMGFLDREDDFAIWQVISRGVFQSSITLKPARKPTVAIYCILLRPTTTDLRYARAPLRMIPMASRSACSRAFSSARSSSSSTYFGQALEVLT